MKTIGMVGVGVMGSAMAGHLLDAGFDVLGFDVAPDRRDALVGRGGKAAASAAEVARGSHAVITSLPSVAAFEEVVGGERSIADGAGDDLVVIETSTLPLDVKERGRQRLAEAGVTLLDCPLSGTGVQARAKDVVVFASGDPGAIARCAPIFEGFAREYHEVGAFGTGSKLKFIANLLVAIHNVSTAEALLLGKKAGLDLELLLRVVGDGAGASRMLQVRGPVMITGEYGDAGIRTRTFQKDVDIISAFAREHECPVPLFAVCAQLYVAALGQGRDDQDPACVLAVLEQLAGVDGEGRTP